jgi:septal ring factor EnvC (AmiA/AmiB activator)
MDILTYITGAIIAIFGILFKVKDLQLKKEKEKSLSLNSQLINSEKKRVTQEVIIKDHEEVISKIKTDYNTIDKEEGDLINKVSEIQKQKETSENDKKNEEVDMANLIYSNFNHHSRL